MHTSMDSEKGHIPKKGVDIEEDSAGAETTAQVRRAGTIARIAIWTAVIVLIIRNAHGQLAIPQGFRTASPDSWLVPQQIDSYLATLKNIGPAAGANDGLVIASPSRGGKDEPDYYVSIKRGIKVSC